MTSVFGTHFRDSFSGLISGTHFRDSKFSGTQNFTGLKIVTGLKGSSAHILPKSNFSEIQNLLSRLLLGILVVLRIILANHFERLIWSINIEFVSLICLFYSLLKHD